MSAVNYRKVTDLPEALAIFPLPSALLFPRWQLPLNVFEPRYLNMIDDAMAGSRMIGMVQSRQQEGEKPPIYNIGCAGRITSYSETGDGRYLISLTGICRYKIGEEFAVTTPYRQVRPEWDEYLPDLRRADDTHLPSRDMLMTALHDYVARNEMEADWSAVEGAPLETLVNALCAGCPFSATEKQALLEAPTVIERADTLICLLSMDMPGNDTGSMN